MVRVNYEALYHLSLSAHELHVVMTCLHTGAVAEADQPVLQHLRQSLLQGVAASLHAERARFFMPPVSSMRPSVSAPENDASVSEPPARVDATAAEVPNPNPTPRTPHTPDEP